MTVDILAEAEERRCTVECPQQPDGRDTRRHILPRVDLHVVLPRLDDEYVAVDGDHGDAHEGHHDAGEDDLSQNDTQLVGDVHRVADERGRHGDDADREVTGGETAQVDVGHAV